MSDSPGPTVSVIMPVHNTERYLAAAVESILKQTLGDLEFIVIDDGSTDRSLEILRRYSEWDSRMHVVSRPNTGYAVALNEALSMARGEFVARMDSDDISLPRRFELQVGFLRSHPEVGAVGGQAVLIDEDGEEVADFPFRKLGHESIDAFHISGAGAMLVHPSVMMRESVLEAVAGYRVELEPAEDMDLWLRMGEVARLANLPDVVLRYRDHLKSTSHRRLALQRQNSRIGANDARRRRGLELLADRAERLEVPGEAEVRRSWARGAYQRRNYRAARKHAMRAVRLEPGSLEGWKLLCGAWMGGVGRPAYWLMKRIKHGFRRV